MREPGTILLVATTNAGKLREIQALLAGVPLDVRALTADPAHAAIAAPEETGTTFADNARLKARYYAAATGLLTVAEDSGLEVDALDGRPGVLSARYPGADYDERFRNLFGELAARGAIEPAQRTARFVCAVALAAPPSVRSSTSPQEPGAPIVFETRGTVEGRLADAPHGAGGFGYDPIFFYPPYGRTLAEVTADEKGAVSHRGAAFRALRAFLESTLVKG